MEISKAFSPFKPLGSGTGLSRTAQQIPGTATYKSKKFAEGLRRSGSDVPDPRLATNAEFVGYEPKYGYSARTGRPTRAQKKSDRSVMEGYRSPEYQARRAAMGPRPAGPPGF